MAQLVSDSPDSLGCGTYEVWVQERCGAKYKCRLKEVSGISWNRVLNDVSTATINVSLRGDCCNCLGEVNPWEHEIALYRDNEEVWVGPIVDMEFDLASETARVECRDLFAWTDHRIIELADTEYEVEASDLKDAFEWVLNHGYCKDPWCMTWSIDNVGIPIERYYPAFDKAGNERWGGTYPTCGQEMRDLSQAGVDYTVVGRHLFGGDISRTPPTATTGIVMDQHLQRAPTIKVSGTSMTNRQGVAGGNGGYDGFYDDQISFTPATIGPITPALLDGFQLKYGLLEAFRSENIYEEVDTTEIPNAVQQAAQSRWDLLHLPHVSLETIELNRHAPFPIETLIPGAILSVALRYTCRKLTDPDYRIREVSVSVDGMNETVTLQLTPVGTTVAN